MLKLNLQAESCHQDQTCKLSSHSCSVAI